MLLVEGVSDGGGSAAGPGLWSIIPLLLSAVAIIFTAVALVSNTRKSARDRVWDYLQLLVSSDTASERSVVGTAARWEQPRVLVTRVALNNEAVRRGSGGLSELTKQQYAQDRDAIFHLLWVVSLCAPALGGGSWLHRLVVGRSTELYRAQVYEHLNLIVPDLYRAFDYWVAGEESTDSARLVDASLSALPEVQRYGKGREIRLSACRFSSDVETTQPGGGST